MRPKAESTIASEKSRANNLIVLVSPNLSDRKGNNEGRKCKLKKYLFGEKTNEKPANFAT